jgi:RNA polymerase sigma-70 factor (ECF subfamily)
MSTQPQIELAMASHRHELKAYCRRMLGSPVDAEDAVQETLLRAWRGAAGFQGRASLRAWLYRIASNVCVDAAHRRSRQPTPTDDYDAPFDHAPEPDPAELALRREDLRLALAAAVHHLSPRQRAVLVLRDILCWPAAEVAQELETSVAAVNSALQRAHAALARSDPEHENGGRDEVERHLVRRYLNAFETDDPDTLASLSCG